MKRLALVISRMPAQTRVCGHLRTVAAMLVWAY